MRRWLALFLLFGAAGALAVWGSRRQPKRSPAPAAAVVPDTALVLRLTESGLQPERSAVPKGHRVTLTFANLSGQAATVVLAGYEGRLDVGRLEDGGTWVGRFLAELPGEDFAWIVNGEPVGRLSVTGSHLSEGAR